MPSLRLAFTGSRRGLSARQRRLLPLVFEDLDLRRVTEFHHGVCVGADAEAHETMISLLWEAGLRKGCKVVGHPALGGQTAQWLGDFDATLPPSPPLQRNKVIVDSCDVLVACPLTDREILRSGTWSTVRYARRRPGLKIILLAPEDANRDLNLGIQLTI